MGCISSKLAVMDGGEKEATGFYDVAGVGDSPKHVVSLTSTTYGALKLEVPMEEEKEEKFRRPCPLIIPVRKSISSKEELQPLEIINAWELMSDLEGDHSGNLDRATAKLPPPTPSSTPSKKKLADPCRLKLPAPPFSTPRRRLVGKEKENYTPRTRSVESSPFSRTARATKPLLPVENNSKPNAPTVVRYKGTPSPKGLRLQAAAAPWERRLSSSSRRRSLTPFFDPELVASFEKELLDEKEHVKKVISVTPKRRSRQSSSSSSPSAEARLLLLDSYEPLCPKGGADSVILYTTSLRGIRKTFEECSSARAAIEACRVRYLERDVSMDSGYREELRTLLGPKSGKDVGISLPVLFVKGRLIGGAAEILKLEEEGRLESLLSGIPPATAAPCEGCGGVGFVLCMECNGSCKVRKEKDEEESKVVVVKCEECNENGLIRCPICC